MATQLIWNGREADDFLRAKIVHAKIASELSFARVQGMKLRAELDPPTAAAGGFPYPARTCAQWVRSEDRGRFPVKRRGRR